MDELEDIVVCRFCDCLIPYKDKVCSECSKEQAFIIPESIKYLSFSECIDLIDNAFFRLESFMKGKISYYNYFGFNDYITKLFYEVRKEENFTPKNCDLISPYWGLAYELCIDIDKGNFENVNAFKNESFCNDWNELCTVSGARVREFLDFDTTKYVESKYSITDIIESRQPQQPDPLDLPDPSTVAKTPFTKNNFDHVPPKRVYDYFKKELVDTNYLSLEDLEKYLIVAFQNKVVPVEKFTITYNQNPTPTKIKKIFYKYYNEIAQDKHGNLKKYCGLLGEYFNGFDTEKLSRNFNR